MMKRPRAVWPKFQDKPDRWLVALWVMVAAYVLFFGLMSVRRHEAFLTSSFDLGNYDQALWNTAHGRPLEFSLVPWLGESRLAAHVEPILFPLALIYLFLPDPRALLWLQAAALGLAGLPLFSIARRALQSGPAALMVAASYLLLPATESTNLFEFHPVAFAPLFLLAAFYFMELAWEEGTGRRGAPYLAALFLLLALCCKEDISLILVALGLYVLAVRRKARAALSMILAGAAWFYVTFYVIIPSHRLGGDGSLYLSFYEELGASPVEVALSPLLRPRVFFGLLFGAENAQVFRAVLLPLAGVPLAGLPILLVAAPSLVMVLISGTPLMHRVETYHYLAPSLAFMMLAAVQGIANLGRWGGRFGVPERKLRLALASVVLVASLAYHHYRGYSPLARPFDWPEVTPHHLLGDRIIASIPPDAAVAAQSNLVPHLSHRELVRNWTGLFPEDVDYVLFDVSHPLSFNRNRAHYELLGHLARNPDFGPVITDDGYILMERGAPRLPTTPEFFTYLYPEDPRVENPLAADFGGELRLVGFDLVLQREDEPHVALYWYVEKQPSADYNMVIYLLDGDGQVMGATVDAQPALVWMPTSWWQEGRVVRVYANTYPWWTGDRSRYALGVGFSRGDDPWDVSARIAPTTGEGRIVEGTVLYLSGFRRVLGISYPER